MSRSRSRSAASELTRQSLAAAAAPGAGRVTRGGTTGVDRADAHPFARPGQGLAGQAAGPFGAGGQHLFQRRLVAAQLQVALAHRRQAVSYTHLTLPTILR